MKKREINTEKLTDKAFFRLLMVSVGAMALCLVCLCSTTFAWYTKSSMSTSNRVRTAEGCLVSVSLIDTNFTDDVSDDVPVFADFSANETESEKEVLLASGAYRVDISLPADSASGYCILTVGTEKYYSPYIARHQSAEAVTVSFSIKVTGDVSVTFTPHWGIYSGSNIEPEYILQESGEITLS